MKLNSVYEIAKVNEAYLLIDTKNDIYFKIDSTLFHLIENCEKIDSNQNIESVNFLISKGILIEDGDLQNAPPLSQRKNVFSITRIKLISFRISKFLTWLINITHIDSFSHWDQMFVGIGFLGGLCSILFILLSTFAISNGAVLLNSAYILKSIPYVYVSYLFISCFHEFGHALMCKIHCGFVGRCGIMFFFLTPAFFTNTTVSKFASKKERIQIVSAGVVFQCAISMLLSIVLMIGMTQSSFMWTILYFVFWLNFVSMVLNLNPLFKYDGYWMLSLIWDIDYLYEKSIASVKNIVFAKRNKAAYNKKLMVYGFAIVLFYFFMWATSIILIYQILFPLIGRFCLLIIAGVILLIFKEIHGWRNMKI